MTIVSEGTLNTEESGTILEALPELSNQNSIVSVSKLSSNTSMAEVSEDENSSDETETEIMRPEQQ